MPENIKLEVCCRDMKAALESKIAVLNDGKICLNREFDLKKPEKQDGKDYPTTIVLIHFCPWCSYLLKNITDRVEKQIKEKENEDGKN